MARQRLRRHHGTPTRAGSAQPRPAAPRSAAARLHEAERLFRNFAALTPYRFVPFVKTFDSFDDYQRWRNAQTNPWYR
ncbi:MAG: hypothetical protein JJE40_04705 [Vicinamibacteria bacterium]|nr:hypothetical protein [Vicinamibacteria bacterium]